MSAPALSVIIPTHKRAPILAACLRHLEHQSIARDLEVIVVSDGHDDTTTALMTQTTWTLPTRFIEIPKAQQGAARNKGVQEAQGAIVLFINDDILLAPGACEAHRTRHTQQGACAVLGHIDWDPAVGVTRVMRWLDATGWQFGFDQLAPYAGHAIPALMQHRFTYASNLSVPLSVARAVPFPEGLTEYGWEDIVFGMELRTRGIRLVYEPAARALHRHRIELEDSLRRMRTIGKTAAVMAARDPAFDRLPRGWKRLAYHALALLPTLRGKHAAALLQGMREGV